MPVGIKLYPTTQPHLSSVLLLDESKMAAWETNQSLMFFPFFPKNGLKHPSLNTLNINLETKCYVTESTTSQQLNISFMIMII